MSSFQAKKVIKKGVKMETFSKISIIIMVALSIIYHFSDKDLKSIYGILFAIFLYMLVRDIK